MRGLEAIAEDLHFLESISLHYAFLSWATEAGIGSRFVSAFDVTTHALLEIIDPRVFSPTIAPLRQILQSLHYR